MRTCSRLNEITTLRDDPRGIVLGMYLMVTLAVLGTMLYDRETLESGQGLVAYTRAR
jgi:hypothetical protein